MEIGSGSELQSGFPLEGHSDLDSVGDFARQFDLLSQSSDVGGDLVGLQGDALIDERRVG